MNSILVQSTASIHEGFFIDKEDSKWTIPDDFGISVYKGNEQIDTLSMRVPNVDSMPNIFSQIPYQLLPEYDYAYRYDDKTFLVKRLLGRRQYNPSIITENSILLVEMLSEIDSLLKNEYDWDEIDYRKPTLKDISHAKSILTEFVFVTTIGYEGYSLTKPYISNSEDGGAKIEWHLDKRSLYLRIGSLESVATMIEDKPDGTTTIDDKPFLQKSYLSLWEWIING